MKPFAKTLSRTLGFACLWLVASNAEAVAPRAYVSVSGSDANVCSNPLTPCRTFTGAIAQTSPGGEVVVLDSGTFGGATITQSVTINAPTGVAALAATAITVNAGASDVVTLRGLTFVAPSPGVGTALTFNSGAVLNVENCVFHGWATGLNFAAAGKLNVTDTTVRDSSGTGIYLSTAGSGAIRAGLSRTRLLDNAIGLQVLTGANATIKDSVVEGNVTAGLVVATYDDTVSELDVEGCIIFNNGWGVLGNSSVAGGFGRARISNSVISSNTTAGLQQANASVILSRINNTIEGNNANTSGTIGTITAK